MFGFITPSPNIFRVQRQNNHLRQGDMNKKPAMYFKYPVEKNAHFLLWPGQILFLFHCINK